MFHNNKIFVPILLQQEREKENTQTEEIQELNRNVDSCFLSNQSVN